MHSNVIVIRICTFVFYTYICGLMPAYGWWGRMCSVLCLWLFLHAHRSLTACPGVCMLPRHRRPADGHRGDAGRAGARLGTPAGLHTCACMPVVGLPVPGLHACACGLYACMPVPGLPP